MPRAVAWAPAAVLFVASKLCLAAEPDTPESPEGPEPRPAARAADRAAPRDPLEGSRSHTVQKDVVPDARGLSIALRAGWGAPQGSLEHGTRLSQAALGVVPLWLDLGYRVSPRWLFGIYAQYAFVAGPDCPDTERCHGSDVRFGLQAQWHFGSRTTADPWLGVGTGFEIFERKSGRVTDRFGGFELANLQLGEDWSLGRRFALGPFVSLSLDRFTSVQRSGNADAATDSAIARRTWHGWMLLGIRLSFGA